MFNKLKIIKILRYFLKEKLIMLGINGLHLKMNNQIEK